MNTWRQVSCAPLENVALSPQEPAEGDFDSVNDSSRR